jgi:hypothetical protein
VNYIDRIAADIQARVPDDRLPDGETASLFRLYAVLALAKGLSTTAEDVHNAWAAWMAGDNPDHESIAPFAALTADVRREDDVFVRAIHATSVGLPR